MVPWGERPLVVGEIPASTSAETRRRSCCYGHFDVQPPDPLELWESDPFELVERDGWLFARGVADDKGQLFMLLKAAELLAAAGELPVNLRFACDGEEEVGGHSIVDWVDADERGADAAIVFDGGMVERDVPGLLHRGARHLLLPRQGPHGRARPPLGHVRRRLAQRDARADADALGRAPARRAAARAAARGDRAADRGGARRLEAAARRAAEIAAAGSRPADAAAAEEFYLRTWAEPSVDVNGIEGGSPTLQKTVIPVEAEANVSIRLVAGQDPAVIVPAFERLLREAAPEGAEVEVELWSTRRPASCRRRAGRPARARRVRGGARRPAAARPLGRRDPARLRARRPRRRHRS